MYPNKRSRKAILICVAIIAVLSIILIIDGFVFQLNMSKYIPFLIMFFSLPIVVYAIRDMKYIQS